MKRILFFLVIAFCSTNVFADLLDDIVSGKYKAARLEQMTPVKGTANYAQLRDNTILIYAYQSGEVVDTLFDAATTRLARIEDVQGFLLSNSKYILVYTNRKGVYRHSFTADYYIFNTERNELKLLGENIMAPVFSPNGRYIAFSRDNNLYVHKLDFGTEVAVTTDGAAGKIINGTPDWLYEEEFGTTCLYSFSPDNKHLAFVRFDETEVPAFRWQDMLTESYPMENQLKYPRAGEANAKVSVVVYDMYYKSLRTITGGILNEEDIYIPRLRWVQAEQLAVWVLNRNQNKLEMLYANPKSTIAKRIYSETSKDAYIDYAQVDEWQFLNDGRFVVVNETSGYRHVYLYSALGQMERSLTKGNYDVTYFYGYDEAKQILYYQAADQSPMTRNIYALNVKKNKTQLLTPKIGWHEAQFSSDMAYFVDNYSSLYQANTYTLCTSAGKPIRTLLDNSELQARFDALQLPKKEFFTFTTPRGDVLNGWMLLPLGFDKSKQYPVLQVQYSGPNSQQVRDRWNIDWEYFLATQGIITVCVDGRGTGARGRDFRTSTYMNLGVQEADDQVYTAQYLQTLPYVQDDKIGIWGWSYGGFMTINSMSHPAGVFACGIAVAPVIDWRLYDSAYTERFMQRPQTNEGGYQQADLTQKAEQLQGRLLLVHGLADDNVHCQNAWKYVEALVQANKQFDMQFYPDDNHFLKKRNNYKHLYNRKWEFVQKYLLNK